MIRSSSGKAGAVRIAGRDLQVPVRLERELELVEAGNGNVELLCNGSVLFIFPQNADHIIGRARIQANHRENFTAKTGYRTAMNGTADLRPSRA